MIFSHRISRILVILLLSLAAAGISPAQNPQRFQKEVDSIVAHNANVEKANVILFTGSSSIRLWNDLKKVFPDHNVVNLGFGGSEMTDLLYYTDKIILQFKPTKIFIYEGDNDVSKGRTPEQVLATAEQILTRIQKELPPTQVIFISAKPSLSRWNLKEKYEEFNAKLKAWTETKKNVKYADIWGPMLKKNGQVRDDIFVADNLHMNEKGYEIWKEVIKRYLD
jgi:lysophospholipase L1-like esterase